MMARPAVIKCANRLAYLNARKVSASISRADSLMARLLFIRGGGSAVGGAAAADMRGAENALTISLMFSGLRCILQYAVLPFLLPIAGIAADATIPILLIINVLAMTFNLL